MTTAHDHARQFALDDDDDATHELSLDEDASSASLLAHPVPVSLYPDLKIPTRDDVLSYTGRPKGQGRGDWKTVVLGLSALLFTAWGVSQVVSARTRFGTKGPRVQVILMISDGFGPSSETLARSFSQYLRSSPSLASASAFAALLPPNIHPLTPLDAILVGSSRTRSSNSLVTDSAAGATAFSCAMKTYNGAIAVAPDKTPCGTVLEAAKRQGFSTGLVTTSRITHATPASFYAHVVDRDLESEIATFLVGSGPQGLSVDLAFGGGAAYFIPNTTTGSSRTDDQDLIALAKARGVKLIQGMEELTNWHEADGHGDDRPVIGLFAPEHMDYEIDRLHPSAISQPSLLSMTTHALTHLSHTSRTSKGFFLMLEGARIDHAAHQNDPAAHVGDILAYHQTVQYVTKWVKEQNEKGVRTVMISVSDHETGGLALGRQLTPAYPEYAWYPDALLNATHSTEYLGALIASSPSSLVTRPWIRSTLYEQGLGIQDLTDAELELLWPHRKDAGSAGRVLADAISRRAQVGWSTEGHSGVDVNLYATGFNSSALAGCNENTAIGDFIVDSMGLSIELITQELNSGLSWFKSLAGKSVSRTSSEKHYHGDH